MSIFRRSPHRQHQACVPGISPQCWLRKFIPQTVAKENSLSAPLNCLKQNFLHLIHTFPGDGGCMKGALLLPLSLDEEGPAEYAALLPDLLRRRRSYRSQSFRSMSHLLRCCASQDTLTRIRQKSLDLRRIVQTALERNNKIRFTAKTAERHFEKRENTAYAANS